MHTLRLALHMLLLGGLLGAVPARAGGPGGSVPGLRYESGLRAGGHQVGHIRRGDRNLHGSHYLFGASAIPLDQGQGIYKNTLLSVNAVNYGLTRHFSVGGGVELISIITGRESGPVYFANAKLAADVSEVFHVGVNAFYINYPFPANLEDPQFTERRPGFSVVTGAVTLGDPDIQLTLSGGISRDFDADKTRPAASVAGMWRLFPRMALITENWLFFDDPDDYSAICFGVRFIGSTVAVDVALVNNKQIREEVLPVGLPIFSVSVAF